MKIDGLVLEQFPDHALCRIETFSDQLKNIIHSKLVAVSYGAAHSALLPNLYSYKNTLTRFLYSYNTKTIDIQKGMIGELLAHILMPLVFRDLRSLSVFLNKEEDSIKKGFDIIYLDNFKKNIWYSEVKSGERHGKFNSDAANEKLLQRARKDIKSRFKEGNGRLWDSALIDVTLTLGEARGKTARNLLSADSPIVKKSTGSNDKNAILVSVLYECPTNPCSVKNLKNYLDNIINEKEFKEVIIFSIQKKTFEKVINFLKEEMNSDA